MTTQTHHAIFNDRTEDGVIIPTSFAQEKTLFLRSTDVKELKPNELVKPTKANRSDPWFKEQTKADVHHTHHHVEY